MSYDKINLDPDFANKRVILCKEDPFFISPQGEGKYMGRLSAWVRTSTCNLKCSWLNPNGEVTLCDTAYTSHKPERNMKTIQEVYNQIMDNKAPHCVITGGEPTMNQSLMKLIDFIEDGGKRVTIETNGTNYFESKASLISISPKLASSGFGSKHLTNSDNVKMDTDYFFNKLFGLGDKQGNLSLEEKEKIADLYQKNYKIHEQNRYNVDSFKKIMNYYGPDRYQFKFVANQQEDIDEIIKLYVEPLQIPSENVYLMPQGISHEQLNDRAKWVIDKCKEFGWHYSDRLHIRIYGNETGV